ncbi:Rz1-like lysis system protein LysC [Haemophilus parahaemolyticus]|uniref:Rz1-like lysis system protein LysC n=1 Tax=Haemophilus parahaemolyticus TaxID=735 RepID=UPI0028E4C1ED|nr:Rz1-like lysis system protein LysC [Haemophilus parahaemolyticus]
MKALKQFWLKSRVLVCLCLVLLLSCCSQRVTIKTEYLAPPQAYLTPCTQTAFTGETYGDAIDYLVVVMSERDLCAVQVDNIREYVEKNKKN